MSLRDDIEARLIEHFSPERLALLNESGRHAVPDGSETHFNLVMVSPAFDGTSPVDRQRAVHEVLAFARERGLHALTMKVLTPAEWEAAGGEVTNPAPPCRGGGRRA